MSRIFRDDDDGRKPRPDDGDKPKLSWSEIDKRKDRSRHAAEDKKPQAGRTTRASSAYNKYKSELNRLFDSGGLASKFKEELGEPAPGAVSSAKRMQALRESSGRDFERLLGEYKKEFGMPDDAGILSRAVSCSDPALLKDAIRGLIERAAIEKIPGKASLAERLRTLELTMNDPVLSGLISDLKKALGF